ncbi:MAG: co-chaperone DjlA [Xanthomonadales bacterium]|nr:co-chaperone DjlA [Xanthomonadales bacterium]
MPADSFNIPRHWWGKIIGGVIGLFRGGLTGAVLGALLGHFVDRFLAGIIGVGATQKAFFDALFATLGHLAKADGRVTESEIRMVESLMEQMKITGEHRQRAIRLFNQGKQAEFDLDATLHPFVHQSVVRQDLRRMFIEILVAAAASSGQISTAESQILHRVAHALKIPAQVFSAMLNARGGGAAGGRSQSGRAVVPMEQAYAQLGLTAKASDAEVKKAYRKLVSQYHPDKLVSHGLPEEMMDIAKNRVREINTAYDRIKQARGFK